MNYEKYTLSQRAMEILEEQGYIFLLITENTKEIRTWEITKINDNELLPKGADHILDSNLVKKYGNIILIDKEGMIF